jgi:hypothetical protein
MEHLDAFHSGESAIMFSLGLYGCFGFVVVVGFKQREIGSASISYAPPPSLHHFSCCALPANDYSEGNDHSR